RRRRCACRDWRVRRRGRWGGDGRVGWGHGWGNRCCLRRLKHARNRGGVRDVPAREGGGARASDGLVDREEADVGSAESKGRGGGKTIAGAEVAGGVGTGVLALVLFVTGVVGSCARARSAWLSCC